MLGVRSGHDAREFARRRFSVVAADFAVEATRAMRALAEPAAHVEIVPSDIFLLPYALDASFDYVLEYVCFCAIDPQRRPEYADLVARLQKPGGVFIDLAFPLGTRPGGPPYAVASAGSCTCSSRVA